MAKSNAELQKDKRAKEKALLDRIGAGRRVGTFRKHVATGISR